MQHMILIRVFLVIFLSDDSFCFPPALETTLALVLLILTGLVSALISVNLINSDGFFGGYNLPGGGGRNFKIRRQRLWWNRTSNLHSLDFCCLFLCGFRIILNLVRIQGKFLADHTWGACLGVVIALLHVETVQDGIRTIHIAVPIRNQVKSSFPTQLCANRASEKFCDLLQNRLRWYIYLFKKLIYLKVKLTQMTGVSR